MPLPIINEPDEALSEYRPFTRATGQWHKRDTCCNGDEPVQLKNGTQIKHLQMTVQQTEP